ncbi:hypothetical protein D9615_001010 [Tricholomella constricta]|uniref:Uncharacterized protein n=1 Tax=Tricholomella constricta TaxID=117010 RepID=A0A8H5HL91_9AGAR|nr:hypothetical protein D9615_001010 [Tricholomella constricta]
MPSVAASHTSTRSRKSSKHAKSRHEPQEERPNTTDVVEKLFIKTVDLQDEPCVKTGSPRPEFPAETLAFMMGGASRRSRCPPEFLQTVAQRNLSDTFDDLGKKFTIVTATEAATFYKKFLGGKSAVEVLATKENAAAGKEATPSVVFAVTVVSNAGRRYVDYYTTWRSKMSAKDLTERRLKFLDSQFRKAARALDNEFKRAAIYGGPASVAGSIKPSKMELEEPSASKSRPSSILVPPPKLKLDAPAISPSSPKQPPLYNPIFSAERSYQNLTFLLLVQLSYGQRHVPPIPQHDQKCASRPSSSPESHKSGQALNDILIRCLVIPSNAVIQESSSMNNAQPTSETVLPPIVEVEVEAEAEAKPVPAPTPRPAPQHLTPEVVRTSQHSIRSSHSKESTKSSAGSTASAESRRSKHKDKEIPEFLIVLLDDRIDQDTRTWHGLEREVSRTSSRTTPSRVSLWDGPLARDNGITYSTPATRFSAQKGEDSSEEEWENSPVIPTLPDPYRMTRSLSERSYRPVIPGAAHHRTGAGTPSPMVPMVALSDITRPSVYPYPPSPYVPAYTSPYQSPIIPGLRPLSRSTYPPLGFHP